MSACQGGTPTGEPKDDPEGNQDIVDALAALPEVEVLMYSADGVPQNIAGELGKIDPAQEAGLVVHDQALRAALPPILKVFRLENKDLALRKINTDETGARHYRYNQKFNGLDVVGTDFVVHVDVKGAIVGANGTARGDISSSLGSIAISDGAANLAIVNDSRWSGVTGRTVRTLRTVYVQTAEGSMHKAYEQMVEGKKGQDPLQDKVYVDVENGAVVAVHPQVHFARNRMTYSANNGTSLPGTIRRTEAQAPTTDVDVNGAHDGAGNTYDLYSTLWGRDGIDNAGMTMISTVHYSSNYCNAFWNNTQMAYGDGNASQNCGPLARSLDVAAHEMTHGVTSRESNLTYSGESGGLNESLSDIWGAGVEAWVDAGKDTTAPIAFSTANDVFLIGDEVLPPFLRSMCDPVADGSSRDVWSSGLGGIDVHYSSGPNNLVFCLMAKGGMHPRGQTNIMVPAIGVEKALRLMYDVNVNRAGPSTNYAAWRGFMEQAATALFDAATKDAVGCAYAAIKVGTAPTSCGGSPPPPPPPPCSLSNGVPRTGMSGAVGSETRCAITVPSGQTTLAISISGGTGDADLYVSAGTEPTQSVYQCRPYLNGNAETCTFSPPTAGTYHIMLHAYTAFSGVTLTGTYSGTTTGDPYLTNGVPVTGLSGASASNKYYRIAVPAGRNLSIRITGPGTGDADLYTRFGARPTTTTYACRPYLNGNTETCNHTTTSTTAGDWYVMLRGYTAYTGVTLIGSF